MPGTRLPWLFKSWPPTRRKSASSIFHPICSVAWSGRPYSGVKSVFEKIVLVTRKTRLEELIERFNTQAQAKFYIEHAGGDFSAYANEHDAYRRSLETVRRAIETGLKIQVMDRALVPTYVFSKNDVIVTLGQDGLVANTAKYVGGQPILAVNPDTERFDGILLPFQPLNLRP